MTKKMISRWRETLKSLIIQRNLKVIKETIQGLMIPDYYNLIINFLNGFHPRILHSLRVILRSVWTRHSGQRDYRIGRKSRGPVYRNQD